MTSRIGKLLAETTASSSFASAQALRSRDLTIIVADAASGALLRSVVALALRCFTGALIIRGDGKALAQAHVRASDLRLGLGCACDGVFVDAHGWTVSVNELSNTNVSATAPAAAFAAAAGVAKLFARLIGRSTDVLHEAWTGPLLDFPNGSAFSAGHEPLDLGRVVVVGGGAIGAGLAHVLRGCGWRCDLGWIDDDRYDEVNHETTLLISPQTARRQPPKAATLAGILGSSLLTVESHEAWVTARHPLVMAKADALVCAVDNSETRRCLDTVGARVVFNAGVGGSREDAGHVLWTRHGVNEPPLSAHYRALPVAGQPSAEAPADIAPDECSRIAYSQVAMAAPFLGLAAGALLAAGLAQQAMGIAAPTNYVKLDLLGLQQWCVRRPRRD
jgi:hypothetical protein